MDKVITWVVRLGAILIAVVFTALFFFFPENCDVDKASLWCRTHPMTFWDILGLIMFYIGLGYLSGILHAVVIKLNPKLENDDDVLKRYSLYSFVLALIGVILIYAA